MNNRSDGDVGIPCSHPNERDHVQLHFQLTVTARLPVRREVITA